MKAVLLVACWAGVALAQSPRAVLRRAEQRRAAATRAVERALSTERQLQSRPPRRGSVAVIAGDVAGADVRGLGPALADLLTTDLARVHALRVVERVQAQAIVAEVTRPGLDEATRPRAWALLGAAHVVVLDARQVGTTLEVSARVVHVPSARVAATLVESDPPREVLNAERRLAIRVIRALGVEPTSSERRSIVDRPAGNVDAFLAYAAAMDALDGGDAPRAERLLRQSLELDPGINAAFDAELLAASGLTTALGNVVPMPGSGFTAGDDPTGEGLATEGNESEYGEAWFEGTGDRRLNLYELSVPLSVSAPLGRGRFDASTLWASNRADTPANDVFHAWGFTDVHVRYTAPLGASGVSLSVGGALPTRNVHGADDDIRRVPLPPDFVPMAMHRRRSAPAASAGFFFTRSLGAWTWGAAAGGEWSASFDETSPLLHTIAVAPGMRWRLRADAERSAGAGRVSLGTSFMALSPAKRAGGSLTGGDRLLLRASYAVSLGGTEIETGAWRLAAGAVRSAGATVRSSSAISTLFVNARAAWHGANVQGGVDLKRWTAGGRDAATLWVPQVMVARPLGRVFVVEIGADYLTGHFHEGVAPADIPVRGWMLRSGFRIEP